MSEKNLTDNFENDSLARIFHHYYGSLCHYAFQLIGDEHAAEDIVQDAFVLLWDHIQQVSSQEYALKNYLYTTVRNLCYNQKRHDKVVNLYLERMLNDDAKRYDEDLDHKMIYSEVLSEINKAIHSLPEACQAVFRLGYLEGLRNQEIALELGVSVNTVKTQKQRGLKILRENLKPEFFALIVLLMDK